MCTTQKGNFTTDYLRRLFAVDGVTFSAYSTVLQHVQLQKNTGDDEGAYCAEAYVQIYTYFLLNFKLMLTSSTSCGRSVGIALLRTQATEFSLSC
jgi:hypothetical protein